MIGIVGAINCIVVGLFCLAIYGQLKHPAGYSEAQDSRSYYQAGQTDCAQ